ASAPGRSAPGAAAPRRWRSPRVRSPLQPEARGPRVWVRCSCVLLGFAGRLGGHAVSRRRERHATRAQPASFPEGVDEAAPAPHVAWGVFHRGLLVGLLPPAVVAGPEESGSAR